MSLLTIRQKFNPTKIGGCKLWLDASSLVLDGVADGGAVTTWRDLSGNGLDAAQATADNKPTLQTGELNGRPVVRFDGSNDYMQSSSTLTLTQPNTIFLVGKTTDANAGQFIDGRGSPPTKRHAIYRRAANATFAVYAGAELSDGASDTNYHVFAGQYNALSSYVAVDGAATSGSGGSQAFDAYQLGVFNPAGGGDVGWLTGDIAEVIIYSGGLATTDRKRVERYLGRKYGIAVA